MAIIGIVICIILSGYFSASEIAFASANKLRLRTKAEAGNKRADQAYRIVEDFDEALSAILIGNNLVNIAASSITTVLIMELVGRSGTALATAIMTVIILIFGEITPKILAKQYADRYVLFSVRPLSVIMVILRPLNKLVLFLLKQIAKIWPPPQDLQTVTQARLSSIIDKVEDEGILDEDASDLLQSALDFPDIEVGEIVTPRVDMYMLDLDDDLDTILQEIEDSPYTRLPVYEETPDNILGILHVTKFLKYLADHPRLTKEEFKAQITDDIGINESMKLPKVFQLLNQGEGQMGIVVDEYGGTVGCVTIEDLLEVLVGDIWDEYDEVSKEIESLDDHSYIVEGSMTLREFCEELDLDYEDYEGEYNTLAGYLLELFGRFPMCGESIQEGQLLFTVLDCDQTKINKVKVEFVTASQEPTGLND